MPEKEKRTSVSRFVDRLKRGIGRSLRADSAAKAMRAELRNQRAYGSFRQEFDRFRTLSHEKDGRFPTEWDDRFPCLGEATVDMGFDRHYIFHTAWAARILADTRPLVHKDISSSLYFSAIASAFVPVEYYEYRAVPIDLTGLTSHAATLTDLPFDDRSVASLSCMHAIEHVGIGRYGDPIDPTGDLKALTELQRVLSPGGNLLIVVPVGRPRVCFNAHRIYSHAQVVEAVPELELEQFALIPDRAETGDLMVNPPVDLVDQQEYGCGCFWFTRPDQANV